MQGRGRGGAGPLREVGRGDGRGAGKARDPAFLRAGQQGGEATGKGAGDGAEQVEEDAGRGAPGVNLDCPQEWGKKPRGGTRGDDGEA